MKDNYSESSLVELPTIELFESLGYEHQNCFHERFGENGTLGRETLSDVVLVPKLKEALFRLNPKPSPEAIDLAIEELTRDRSSLNPVVANREIHKMINDGVKVAVRNEHGDEEFETVKVIDFDNPENNDFFLASQFWVTGEMYKRRADLVGFVNGLPLIFIELKASHKRLENAYRNNLTDYKTTIPQLFWYNAFIILSNGSESRIGTITADYDHFSEWKKILRKFNGDYTFLIVTDRKELDEQIYKNFLSVGAVTEKEAHAESREHLKQLLRENLPLKFTKRNATLFINTSMTRIPSPEKACMNLLVICKADNPF